MRTLTLNKNIFVQYKHFDKYLPLEDYFSCFRGFTYKKIPTVPQTFLPTYLLTKYLFRQF